MANMEYELINGPHSIKEVKDLIKNENIFMIVNTYQIIAQLYDKAKKDKSELDFNDCWKLKKLKKLYEHSTDPETFIIRMTHETFIKIS